MSDKQPILFLSKLGYARDGNKGKKEEKKRTIKKQTKRRKKDFIGDARSRPRTS
jgi:hypothetical protein